jgi:hypothetical protein
LSANSLIRAVVFLCVGVVLNLHGGPAFAQYMYLDANADSINTESDSLAAAGTVDIDVWLVTNQDRTGTSATCSTGQQLTINSYEVILRAVDGEVSWNGFTNAQAAMSVALGYRSNDSDLYVGYGGGFIANLSRNVRSAWFILSAPMRS